MKISVIIPVYNAERYLQRCLDSVFVAAGQLGPNHSVEVICVDDGSSDDSLRVLRAYGKPLTILTQANAGQGAARNAAIAVATGDALTFVDSDDYIIPSALRLLVTAAVQSGAPVVSSMAFARDAVPEGEHGEKWYCRPAKWMAGKKVQYSVCGKLFKREALNGLAFPTCIYEDFAFATEVFGNIDRFAVIDDPLYVYCSNGSSSTIRSALTVAKVEASFTVMRHVIGFFQNRTLSPFVRGQLSDGLSSTVGQVYKANTMATTHAFFTALEKFKADYPAVNIRLTLKACYRLGRLRSRFEKERT